MDITKASLELGNHPLSDADLLAADVEDVTNKDHDLTILQAIRIYPKAVAWSIVLSAAPIMDGSDLHLMGLLYAQPAFRKAHGELQPDGSSSYQIPAAWQSGLNNGSAVGQLIGLAFAGYLSEKFGFRRTMLLTLLLTPCLVFIQFFAPSLVVLEVGQILLGIPMGTFQTITCVYAVEVAPTCLRAFLTSYVSQMWVIGQIVATCVVRSVLNMETAWAYRIPFAVQWFWPIPIFVAVLFAPESPWWLVRQNRLEDAKASLRRLTSARESHAEEIDKTVALMVLTTEYERQKTPHASYVACFRGTDLRRTLIAIACYCMQIVGGTTLRAYATYFFEQAGLPTTWAFNMSIITYVVSFVGTVISWFLMPFIGRRTLFLWGLYMMTVIYFVIGGLGVPPPTQSAFSWAIASLLVVNGVISYVFFEPIIFALVAEIPSTLLRSKTVAVARFVYNAVNIAANVVTPYQINPSAWGWGAKSGFFWGGTSILGLGVTYFFTPETKDRTITELDLLFEKNVPARGFARTEVHASEVAARGH